MSEQVNKVKQKGLQWSLIIVAAALAFGGVSSLPLLFKTLFGRTASIAVVNDIPITLSEFRRQTVLEQHKLASYRQQFGEQASLIMQAWGISQNPQQAALEQLINDKVVLSLAQRLDIVLSPTYVSLKLQDPAFLGAVFGSAVPSFLYDGNKRLDSKKLATFLSRQGMTMAHFEQSLEDLLQEYMFFTLASGAAVVSDAAFMAHLRAKYGTKTFAITRVPLTAFIKKESAQAIPEAELEAFYKQQSAVGKYAAPEKRGGSVWIFKQKPYDILSGGKEDESDFSERFLKDAQEVLQGSDAQVTSFMRQKNGVKKLLGLTTIQDDNVILKKLFALAKGQRTAFVHEGVGYILELTKLEKGAAKPLDEVVAQVKSDMYKERAYKTLEKELDKAVASSADKYSLTVRPGVPVADKHLPVDRMARMFRVGQSITGMTEGYGYKVELVEIAPLAERAAKDHYQEIWKEVERESSALLTQELVASSREHATITIDSSVLQQ